MKSIEVEKPCGVFHETWLLGILFECFPKTVPCTKKIQLLLISDSSMQQISIGSKYAPQTHHANQCE